MNKKLLKKIIREELYKEAGSEEFQQILSDPDIPMTDKGWLRMLGRVSGERMAVKVFRAKQAEESGGGGKEEEDDGDPGYTLPRPKEDPMGRGAQTSKLRQKSTNWRK